MSGDCARIGGEVTVGGLWKHKSLVVSMHREYIYYELLTLTHNEREWIDPEVANYGS